MDFDDTPEEADVPRGRARLPRKNAKRREPGAGMVYRAGNEDPEFRKRAKAWQAKKADAGYAGITWPKDWGGRGGTPIQQVIYDQEEAKYAVPRGLFDIGLGMCIPTICTWGTQAQRDRFARKALRGEEVWCQLFSEPAAGSDLAGLRTRAERDGDDWVDQRPEDLDLGRALLRLRHAGDAQRLPAPKHKGLTYFFLDMKSPGIEMRPIKQISGAVALQRGVLHRRAHPRQPAPGRGRRGLEGVAHDADERALHDRRALERRRRGHLRAGPQGRAGRRPGAQERGRAREARRLVRVEPGRSSTRTSAP